MKPIIRYEKLSMKQSVLIIALFIILALPALCLGDDDKLFDKIDANKDGTLSSEELSKSDLEIVTRKDGTKQVQSHEHAGNGPPAQPLTAEDKKKLLERIDQDKNGSISRKEWNRASPNGFVLWRF